MRKRNDNPLLYLEDIDKAAHGIYEAELLRRARGAICPRCGAELKTAYHEARLYSVECCNCETVTLVKASNPYAAAEKVGVVPSQAENASVVAFPAEYYHEDYGTVLWWHFPVEEPPVVGTPDSFDRYGAPIVTEYHTHWSFINVPNDPTAEE